MGQPIFDRLGDWGGGVVTSGTSDRLARNASPRGRNSWLTSIGPDGAVPAKRRGFTVVNSSNSQVAASSNDIIAMFQHRTLSSGAFTRYHLLYTDGGTLGTIASDPGGSGTFTSLATSLGSAVPDFATANNLAFLVNGTSLKKLRDGTTVETFGITRPSTAPTLAAGAAGTPSGTYEARVTFYNGNTAHESSAGPTSSSLSVTSQIINFSAVPVSADAQVTARRIYLRNTTTQANFYLAATINDNTTTTSSFNAADTTLITLGPDTAENDPPPSTVHKLAWHRSRLFAADDSNIYFSKIELPEAFDPDAYEPVAPKDGQKITALYSYGDVLLIFKSRSLYGLFGVDPATWQIRLISSDVGCSSHRSVVAAETALFWWSELGPVSMVGLERPINIGLPLIAETISNSTLAYGELDNVVAAVEPNIQLVLFGVADNGETRNTRVLPFSYRLNRWVSDGWNGIEAASLATVEDSTGRKWVYHGNYNGQVFRHWDADNDGVPGGTVTGTFTAASSSISSITGTGFYASGQDLEGRYVTVETSDGVLVGQRRISDNTSTTLTLASSLAVTSGTTYTYHIGGPAFEWDTRDEDSDLPFHKKRYEYVFVQTEDTAATVGVDVFLNFNDALTRSHSYSTSSSTQGVVTKRLRAAGTGVVWRVRVRNHAADAPLTLYEVGMSGVTQTTQIST